MARQKMAKYQRIVNNIISVIKHQALTTQRKSAATHTVAGTYLPFTVTTARTRCRIAI